MDEPALIERIRARVPATRPDLLTPIGDDAAVVKPARNRAQAVTTDMLVEGVHFRREWSSPGDIGAKAIGVNVSDLGAMGAEPALATLSLALPLDYPVADLDALAEGVGEAARLAGLAIAGGNLTRSPGPLIVDVTAIGYVHPRKVLRRDGAKPGDAVYVTGTLGAAAAGLAWLQRNGLPEPGTAAWRVVRRACRPVLTARAGVALSRAGASQAAMDLSDGFANGVLRLAAGAGAGMQIDINAIPVDPDVVAVARDLDLEVIPLALGRGDDYELLFTVSPRARSRFSAALRHMGTTATRVGEVTAEPGIVLAGALAARVDVTSLGFDHFRSP